MPEGPLFAYRERQRRGELERDPMQSLAAERLQSLWRDLGGRAPGGRPAGWRPRLGLARRPAGPAPRGIYLHGGVGRGKSMLMDLFFAAVAGGRKRRVHFHGFMLEIHAAMHRLRADGRPDPLARAVRQIADRTGLLCFDELQVGNIADAMILGRLFEGLLDGGVVVVATSNSHPDDLYRDGLQRDRFLPFIDTLKARLDVLEIEARHDYRRTRLAGARTYHSPLGAAADAALDRAFAALTDGAEGRPAALEAAGRRLDIPAAARGVARFRFAELCERPLGAPDYLAIADAYHAVVLAGVPVLTPARADHARRLMTFVDALYERRGMLVVSAEAAPDGLCPAARGAPDFERTASRLVEMQSAAYIGRTPPGRPRGAAGARATSLLRSDN